MKKLYKEWNVLLWGSVLFAGLNFILSVSLKPLTLDLTFNKLHTLSKGSKEILKKLPEPVTLKLFYSKTAAAKGPEQIRDFNNHFEYTRELLKLYESNSQNKVKLFVIDPRPDTDEEEEAVMSGLKKFQLTDTETYIFGLVAESQSGTKKIIEFFDPSHAEKIEYEISKLLSSLHQGNKKRLGIISSETLSQTNEWWISQAFEDLYTTTYFSKDLEEIKDVDLVFLFGTTEIDDKLIRALDQFIVGGGRVVILIDPLPTWNQQKDQKLTVVSPLLKSWGVSIPEKKFAGDLKYAAFGRTNPMMPPQRLLPVFQCQKDCLGNVKSPLLSSLNLLTFVYPGVIQKDSIPKELSFEPLIQTSPKGNVYEDSGLGLRYPQMALEKFKEGSEPVVVAAHLSGIFPAAFKETKIPEQRKKGSVILIADQDFLRNEFAFTRDFLGTRPSNDNAAFFLNNVDSLLGSSDLMEIRSRGSVSRPFTRIKQIQLEAEKETRDKVASINASLSRFQAELSSLAGKATENNLGLIQSEGLRKQKELQKEIVRLKGELRDVKRSGREKIENIGSILYFINVAALPLMLALIYFIMQRKKKKEIKQQGEKVYENINHAQTT